MFRPLREPRTCKCRSGCGQARRTMFFLGEMSLVARALRLLGIGPIALAACSLYGTANDDEPAPAPSVEAGADGAADDASLADASDAGAPSPRCDLSKPFGTPKQVPGVNTSDPELNIWLSDDEKTAYLTAIESDAAARWDVFTMSRASRDDTFGPRVRMTDVDLDNANTEDVTLTPNGLLVAFSSTRVVADGGVSDLFIAERTTPTAPFGSATPIANVNDSIADEQNPFLTADGLELFFNSTRNGDWELFHAVRGMGGSFGAPVTVGLGRSSNAALTRDGLTLYFSRHLDDGSTDIWVATRATPTAPFTGAKAASELESPARDVPGWVSPDGCRIYFMSARPDGPGAYDQWFADKPP